MNKGKDEDKSENNQQASRTSNRIANKPKPNYRENRSYINRIRILPAFSENESETESNLGENKIIKEKIEGEFDLEEGDTAFFDSDYKLALSQSDLDLNITQDLTFQENVKNEDTKANDCFGCTFSSLM